VGPACDEAFAAYREAETLAGAVSQELDQACGNYLSDFLRDSVEAEMCVEASFRCIWYCIGSTCTWPALWSLCDVAGLASSWFGRVEEVPITATLGEGPVCILHVIEIHLHLLGVNSSLLLRLLLASSVGSSWSFPSLINAGSSMFGAFQYRI
jgi:hypothetical protein